MYYVRFTVGRVTSNTAVCDIAFDVSSKNIVFTPISDILESFIISNCTLKDFDLICGVLRDSSFVNLDLLGFKVFFD